MGSSGRYPLLVYNSAAALVGIVLMFVVFRSSIVASPTTDDLDVARLSKPEFSPQVDRLAFVPPGMFAQPDLASSDPQLRPSITSSSEAAGSLSAEIQPAQPAPSFTLLPSFRLPWQTALRTAPKQTYALKARLAAITPTTSIRLAAKFEAAKAVWPPAQVALIAIKDEKILELHAKANGGAWSLIHRYRVLAASGGIGPKLRQGDKQVPEGVYGIAFLNPNSAYHLSLRVNYPNAFDRQTAAKDGRKDLGGNIMIHGKNLSAGCLAMGDEAVEELFLLAAQTGLPNVKLVIAPTDFRVAGLPAPDSRQPEWVPKLYAEIAMNMSEFKAPPRTTGLLSFFMN